ncbi:hypothetical protein [Brevundimonas viscosa]|uniref:Uncharacterized protein n=1 Tax=Brevundimonas viscosa TaxID=871741 RepID=A0A1I6NW70_9CAUL|nr:hypothetical protein [Brevundimonas viscosa]SFS32181.1 hypothetical protein SAMN05192570_0583 [Brevundimonas viscosa]
MRRPILVLLAAALVGGCQPPAEEPASAPAGVELPTPEMPLDAPPQEEVDPGPPTGASATATDGSCRSQVGEAAAARLVERCVMVSPATHPPCNVANPCALIQGEIDRACALFDPDDRPAECGA